MPATYPMLQVERCNSQDKHNLGVQIVFGASSVASYKGQAMTVARANAGEYTITLPMPYRRIQMVEANWYRPSGVILQARITDKSALTTTGVITVKTVVNAGTATDPDSGDELYLVVGVSNDPLNEEYGG